MAKAAKAVQEETTKLAVAGAAGLPAVPLAAWGSEGISNSDVLVPKLLLMQGLSDLVSSGEAIPGQIRDSLSGALFGGMLKAKENPVPMEFVPFSCFRTWVVFEKRNGKDEYVATLPINSGNEGLPISEVVNGIEIRRDKCLNFYGLRPEEIKEGCAFPYAVSFRRTSMTAGKKLATMAKKLEAFNKPLAFKVVNLTCVLEENEKGKYYVYDLSQGRNSSEAELAAAYNWYQTLQTAKVRVDDSDLQKEATPARPAAGVQQNTGRDNIQY